MMVLRPAVILKVGTLAVLRGLSRVCSFSILPSTALWLNVQFKSKA